MSRMYVDCQTASVDYLGGAYCLIVLYTVVLAPCAVQNLIIVIMMMMVTTMMKNQMKI